MIVEMLATMLFGILIGLGFAMSFLYGKTKSELETYKEYGEVVALIEAAEEAEKVEI